MKLILRSIVFVFMLCVSALISADIVWASSSCRCIGSISGLLCDINPTTIILPLNKSVTIDEVKSLVDLSDCGIANQLIPQLVNRYFGGQNREDITEGLCTAFANVNGSEMNHVYSLICQLSDNPPSIPGGPMIAPAAGGAPGAGSPAPDQPAKKQRNVELINPIGGTVEKPKGETNLQVVVGRVIKKALGVIGSLTLVVFIYGGFLWLTSAGADDKVKQGTQTMLWAVIGICIIFGAYVILNLVLTSLSGG